MRESTRLNKQKLGFHLSSGSRRKQPENRSCMKTIPRKSTKSIYVLIAACHYVCLISMQQSQQSAERMDALRERYWRHHKTHVEGQGRDGATSLGFMINIAAALFKPLCFDVKLPLMRKWFFCVRLAWAPQLGCWEISALQTKQHCLPCNRTMQ